MNTEELELSLRSEFEAHLKKVFADVQQQVAAFQNSIDAELGKHRSQMLDTLNAFSSQISSEPEVDKAFSQSVIEHLRIARDDGAKLAAKAMADAETMDSDSPSSVSFNFARDAVNDISSQTSQAAILQTLVKHCEHFTPRGIFFIVRNEHFVGWQAFGDESKADESAVRGLNFSVSSDTVLGDAIRNLTTTERTGSSDEDNSSYLQPLGFKAPSSMRSIPLVARGRGVAALYVDGGVSDRPVNIEALEMLVRVAGLTVELLASNQAARPAAEATQTVSTPSPSVTEHKTESSDKSQFVTNEPSQEVESYPASSWQDESEAAPAWNTAESEPVHESISETESEPTTTDAPSYEVETFASETAPVKAEVVDSFEPTTERSEPEIETSGGFTFTPQEEFEPEVQHFQGADVVETSQADEVETPQFESNGHSVAESSTIVAPCFFIRSMALASSRSVSM